MGRYAIECPYCQTLNGATTFILAKLVVTCGNYQKKIDMNLEHNDSDSR